MDTQLLERLLQVGSKLQPAFARPENEPQHVYFTRDENGSLKKCQADAYPRKNMAASLDAIVEMMQKATTDVEVWYSRTAVTLYLDSKTRRDTVSLPVGLSAQVNRLFDLQGAQPAFQQAAFVKFLRIDLHGCLGMAGNLIEIVRRVKFHATQRAEGVVEHGKTSLGKAITAEVTGTGTIPESITLDVPVFANACFSNIRESVECAVEPVAETSTFQLIPFPGAIERAVARGEAEIGEKLKRMIDDAGLDVVPLYGQP